MSIPFAVEDFVARYIDSIETLEILLLLHRAPDTFWMPAAVESQLGMKRDTADGRMQALQNEGLLVRGMTGAYRYSPTAAEAREEVSALAVAYAEQRWLVVDAVFGRNKHLRAFSDAFRVKSE